MPPSTERRDKAVTKYLQAHAEPEARAAQRLPTDAGPWSRVLTIPAYGESETLVRTLASVPPDPDGRSLVVLVVNESRDAPRWARAANASTLTRLRQTGARPGGEGIDFVAAADFDLVLIDRTEARALPPREGVGLARKIGTDYALAAWSHGRIECATLYCSDADVVLPPDYFARSLAEEAAVHLFDYRHEAVDDPQAILEYEIYLRYHVLGLHAAGSPFAWPAIGSTLAIDARAYAQVRGFPKRKAAEDFHLLAKLAKVGPVRFARGEPLRLSGRESARVPFGTGRAMRRAQTGAQRALDPRVYFGLEAWLDALARFAREPTQGLDAALASACRDAGHDPAPLAEALASVGALEAAKKASEFQGDRRRFLNERFDALATLRLLHALRDRLHADVPLADALAGAPFLDPAVAEAKDDLEAARNALVRQECRCLR